MLTRGLALLAAYRPGEFELSQVELARRTGLPKPTVHRLVSELVEWNALERTRSGVRLGQWLYLLGVSVPRIGLLRALGQPHLDRLHELTREHVCLSVLCGRDALDIAFSGAKPWSSAERGPRPGTVSEAAAAALIADERGPHVFTARTSIGQRGLIPTPRSGRFASNRLASVAVPVFVFDHAVAAVSVVGPDGVFDVRATGSHVRATAVAFARKLALTEIFGEQFADGLLGYGGRATEFHTEERAVPELVGGRQNESVR